MDEDAPKSTGSEADLSDLRARLAATVLERGYERREEPFRLSSGGFSRDYVDLRRAVARGDALELAARAVIAALADAGVEYDVIGGMTMGADPVAHAVALLSGRSWFSVRKAPKEHGTGRRTEGAVLESGVRAVVFEDTVSTGRSLLEALEVVGATPASVVAVCTILDRGPSLAAKLAELGELAGSGGLDGLGESGGSNGSGDSGEAGRSLPLVRVLTEVDLGIEPI